jgi:hypothetical protein
MPAHIDSRPGRFLKHLIYLSTIPTGATSIPPPRQARTAKPANPKTMLRNF